MRALAHQIRDDPVEPDAREQQGHRSKGVKQNHREAPLSQRVRNGFVHRLWREDYVLSVLALDHAPNRIELRGQWTIAQSHHPDTGGNSDHSIVRKLPKRLVEFSAQRLILVRVPPPLLYVTDNTNNSFRLQSVLADSFTDWIRGAKQLSSKHFINHRDPLRSFIILIGKEATLL